ncbi:hypothetical protein [Clostridium porci]|uniref:hypothetical protein n=1 Tax=Clostridium porci TaxID=2605778 RepID=UPI0012B3E038|nr:hypothetical protein [Clostridium porci]
MKKFIWPLFIVMFAGIALLCSMFSLQKLKNKPLGILYGGLGVMFVIMAAAVYLTAAPI